MVWAAGSMVMALGARPAGNLGWGLWQLVVTVALQVAALMTVTLLSSRLLTATVWLAGSKAMLEGPKPTVTVGGVCPHPVVVAALQAAPLITDTVPDPSPFWRLAT